MSSRTLSGIFALMAICATAVAYGLYVQIEEPGLSPSPTPTPSLVLSPTPTPSLIPTLIPSTKTTELSESQNLAVANTRVILKSGDSLAKIAGQHSISSVDLLRVNSLANADKVFAGQTLIVPDSVKNNEYTILYTYNQNRSSKELKKHQSGTKSVYNDPVTATIADSGGLFGIGVDTPFSTQQSSATKQATLSTRSDTWFISVGLEQDSNNFWTITRILAKFSPPTPTPSP